MLALLLATASGAQATILTTGLLLGPKATPLRAPGSTYCFVTNAGSREAFITMRALDEFGGEKSGKNVTLAPGESAASVAVGVNFARCEFAIQGNPRTIRASGCAALDFEGCQALDVAR
jgi:hypothetical protein